MDQGFKKLSVNVKCISSFLKKRTILTCSRNSNTATTFLQETNSTIVTEVKLKNEWERGQRICSHGIPNSRGVAILVKNVVHSKIVDPPGKFIVLKAAMKVKNRFCLRSEQRQNWSKYREMFASSIIWNKQIRIIKMPVYYKYYINSPNIQHQRSLSMGGITSLYNTFF